MTFVLVSVLSATALTGVAFGATETRDGDAGSVERATTAIERQFDDMRVDEASYAVISGEEQAVSGYGTASADTPFVIASVSKSFTALATLQLVDRGLIELDAPVTDYIDWFTTSDSTSTISIRQLLNQTSGLSTLDGVRDLFSPDISLEERVRATADYTLISDPGAEFNYSNINYAVLGLIVEKVSGRSYGEFVTDQILRPLSMEHSYFDLTIAEANGLAKGTITVFGLPVSVSQTASPALVPDGYLISTAADMATYARFQMGDGSFNGVRLLSPESMAMMHAPSVVSQGSPFLDHYAMGWRTGTFDGETLFAHDGNTFGFHADVSVLPESDAAVVVLVARSGATVRGLDTPALEALTGGTPAVSRSSSVAWIVIDVVLALLVFGSILYLMRRRRRREANPRRVPKRWPAIVQVVAGALIGAGSIFLASSLAGGLDVVTLRIFWGLAPDVLILAVATPVLLIAAGIATFQERRTALHA